MNLHAGPRPIRNGDPIRKASQSAAGVAVTTIAGVRMSPYAALGGRTCQRSGAPGAIARTVFLSVDTFISEKLIHHKHHIKSAKPEKSENSSTYTDLRKFLDTSVSYLRPR
jgi:hypothetical protein